jgi:uncharacterized protein with FMN-binding domain
MLRRVAAVGVLTVASLTFAIRFRPPPVSIEEADFVIAGITVEAPEPPPTTVSPPATREFTVLTVAPTTTTTLPPGVEVYESTWIRFERGVLQLEVTLTYGEITDIEMVRTPSSSERAKEINIESHPLLKAEALAIQDYNVHIVSGATRTTFVWAQALKDALEKADFCLLTPRSLCDMPLR